MVVVDRDVWVLPLHLVNGALPEVSSEGQHIGLVHQGEVTLRAAVGEVEGVANAAFDTESGVDAPLRGDLRRGTSAEDATFSGVGTLGVLADHHEICTFTNGADLADEGAEVDVLIEGEAKLEEESSLQGATRNPRVTNGGTNGAEENGIGGAERIHGGLGEHFPIAQVPIGAEVELNGLDSRPSGTGDLNRCRTDFGANAVPADDCDGVACHGVPSNWLLPGYSGEMRTPPNWAAVRREETASHLWTNSYLDRCGHGPSLPLLVGSGQRGAEGADGAE